MKIFGFIIFVTLIQVGLISCTNKGGGSQNHCEGNYSAKTESKGEIVALKNMPLGKYKLESFLLKVDYFMGDQVKGKAYFNFDSDLDNLSIDTKCSRNGYRYRAPLGQSFDVPKTITLSGSKLPSGEAYNLRILFSKDNMEAVLQNGGSFVFSNNENVQKGADGELIIEGSLGVEKPLELDEDELRSQWTAIYRKY